ncbi:MAG: ATP-binding protein [Erysipelotrichaceae bacterium]|nr:ATP-binding protein [Erysipelotrichaceae bacterium]
MEKKLNMSMMAEFFDITKYSEDVFNNTNIMNTEYASYMNQYPTIFLSFASSKGNKNYLINSIKTSIRSEYAKYHYIFTNMEENDEEDYYNLKEAMKKGKNSSLDGVEEAILFLMNMLYKYYDKKVLLFVDEYDTPFIEAHVNGFYEDIRKQLASLLHNALKDAEPLEYAMLTGIQRVANENIFSDLNNVAIYSVARKQYSQYFGFTEGETKELLEYYHLELNDDVKQMYDGYHIGNDYLYNPWSILNYVDNEELDTYWIYTSSNTMIKNAIRKADITFKNSFEILIEQGYVDVNIELGKSFYENNQTSTLWGMFVNAGYLTIENKIDIKRYRIVIPNFEVVDEFKEFLSYYFDLSSVEFLDNIINSLLYEDKNGFLTSYTQLLLASSYHDLTSENSYHMLLYPLCLYLSNTHEVKSNPEEGKGRTDIILKARSSKYTSYVIEFKHGKKEDNLDKLADDALTQIKEKKYDANLTGRIIHIGLGLYSKNVAMKWIVK